MNFFLANPNTLFPAKHFLKKASFFLSLDRCLKIKEILFPQTKYDEKEENSCSQDDNKRTQLSYKKLKEKANNKQIRYLFLTIQYLGSGVIMEKENRNKKAKFWCFSRISFLATFFGLYSLSFFSSVSHIIITHRKTEKRRIFFVFFQHLW